MTTSQSLSFLDRQRHSHCCKFCGCTSVSGSVLALEMMLGLRDEFRYDRCANCESLELVTVPEDLGRYYPANYYSFSSAERLGWKQFFKRKRDTAYFSGSGILGCLLLGFLGPPAYAKWMDMTGTSVNARILDVGSGGGGLLFELAGAGFQHLTGIDPYLPGDSDDGRVRLRKMNLDALDDEYDLIMFHHSLEHMPDPERALVAARCRLSMTGALLIRVPIAGSWACKAYGPCWVQLDAPRHLSIPSMRGMKALAARTGLTLAETSFDSHSLQFYGSEMYKRGIPLSSRKREAIFSRAEIRDFARRSEQLNARGDGDAACLILRKS